MAGKAQRQTGGVADAEEHSITAVAMTKSMDRNSCDLKWPHLQRVNDAVIN